MTKKVTSDLKEEVRLVTLQKLGLKNVWLAALEKGYNLISLLGEGSQG